jgi:hypothetical protein
VKYYYDKADFAGMKQELSTIDWEEKLSMQDENKQWNFFKDTVLCMFIHMLIEVTVSYFFYKFKVYISLWRRSTPCIPVNLFKIEVIYAR